MPVLNSVSRENVASLSTLQALGQKQTSIRHCGEAWRALKTRVADVKPGAQIGGYCVSACTVAPCPCCIYSESRSYDSNVFLFCASICGER